MKVFPTVVSPARFISSAHFCVAFLVLLAGSLAAPAGEPESSVQESVTSATPVPSMQTSVPVLLAEEASTDNSWSIRKVFALANNRTRAIQICVALMCLALLIMIKK
jgi:hypothetical protein